MGPSVGDWQAVADNGLLRANCLYDLVFTASKLKLKN